MNDRGAQLQRFADSLRAVKDGEPVPEDGYRGAYVEEWAAEMPADADPLEWGLDRAIEDQRETLASMGVIFDRWSSERALVDAGAMDATLTELRQLGHVYDADGAVWLRTTDFGDDRDRVLVRANGEPTYFLPDIAYHRDKLRRADHLIDVWGPDHHGYVARVQVAMQALNHRRDDLEIIIGQNVVLLRAGEEVKLSKRKGDIILLREDVIDEVGPDATRFTYLMQSIDTKLVFDLDVVVQQSMDNPSSTCRWPTPASPASLATPPPRASPATRSRSSTSACSPTSASTRSSPSSTICPAWSSTRRRAAPPTRSRRGRARWPRRCTASTTTAGSWPTTFRPS